jgi:phosphoglycerol transferase MdoB-like AlkP superfamily enzyme
MGRSLRGLALSVATALVVLVTGHNLVFLLTYGADYGVALARTGHDSRWTETIQAVLIAASLLATAAFLRIAYLVGLVQRLRPGGGGRPDGRAFLRILAQIWIKAFLVATILFVVQENYERWTVGLGLPGFAVLGSFGVGGPVLVFLVVSLVASVVAALFEWGIAELEARIAAIRGRAEGMVSPVRRRRPEPIRPSSSILGRNLAGRAPPAPLTQH